MVIENPKEITCGNSSPVFQPCLGTLNDGSRSAFLPYKPVTVLTNLQRGNTKAKTKQSCNDILSFFQLAAKGDLTVEQISQEPSLDVFDKVDCGLTPLMWASAYGQSHTVEDLLVAGACVHLSNSLDQTALHFASNAGYPDVVKILLAWGADVNAVDLRGNTPLAFASKGNHPLTVSYLLTNAADISVINADGSTAYKISIQRHHCEVQQMLENHMKQLLIDDSGLKRC